MHPCLLVPELSYLIFESLNPFLTRGSGSHLKDLAAVARTCQALSATALDALWHTQHSLAPLALCLGDDIVEVEASNEDRILTARIKLSGTEAREANLGIPITEYVVEWERALPYARRIKVISSDYAERKRWSVDDTVVSALLTGVAGNPFPRLTHLEYNAIAPASSELFIGLVSTLLNTNVTSLQIHVSKEFEHLNIASVLSVLPDRCPWIRNLSISLDIRDPKVLSQVPYWIAPLRFLEHLDLQMRYTQGPPIPFATSYPSSTDKCPPQPIAFLPRLRTLKMTSRLTHSIPFVQHIHSPSLEEIRLTFVGQLTGRALSTLCACVTARPGWMASLRVISLSGGDPIGETSCKAVRLSAKDLSSDGRSCGKWRIESGLKVMELFADQGFAALMFGLLICRPGYMIASFATDDLRRPTEAFDISSCFDV
ncbi:hypothetical protein BJ138DRAFT_1100116 [Hygrophoropsis aurantiaca]|uniref:Uncharacterized protein n=1 Tax=Hygrophoropsis aurantiaca TaxID=72124 RepID=A0ACB8AI25_9AGAM|nr:hypothetical protein BJ138DRAFT_1100116 [Hygrophoropsis aurantiaca]